MQWGWGGSWTLVGAWEKLLRILGLNWAGIAFIASALLFLVYKLFETRCPSCGKFFAAIEQGWREISRTPEGYEHVRVRLAVSCKCAVCGHEWTLERSHKSRRTSTTTL